MDDKEKALVPVEQKQVEFYGDTITAVRLEDGTVYVPIRPICKLLGIDWSAQRQRIQRDLVLSDVIRGVVITPTPLQGKFANPQEMAALPLDYLNGWIFSINANRVKDEIRDSLVRYQRDCYKVLADAFGRNQITAAPNKLIDEALRANTPAAQTYKMILAVAEMARQQLIHEQTLSHHNQEIGENRERIEAIEAKLGNADRFITVEQASQISQAVKAIALELGKRSSRNEYGGVYGELYRRFGITSYKELPSNKYDEAMTFLRGWYQTIVGSDDIPF